jgi:hypothetical protein
MADTWDDSKSQGISPEDLGIFSGDTTSTPPADEGISPEQLGIVTAGKALTPAEDQGWLTAVPGEGYFPATGKYLATGAIKGLSHIPGLPGDIREGTNAALAYTLSKMKGTSYEDEYKNLVSQERQPQEWNETSGYAYLPTGEDISRSILAKTGEYKPSGPWGRAGMAGIEAAASTVSPTGKAGLVENALKMAKTMIPAFVSGAASQTAGEQTGSPFWSLLSGLVAHQAATVAPRAAGAHFLPTDPAERLAGQTIRESATDIDAARRALGIAKEQQATGGAYLPGFTPEIGQITEDPGVLAMQRRLATDTRLKPPGTDTTRKATELDTQQQGNVAAVQRGAESAAYKLSPLSDQEIMEGLQDQPTRQASSTAARKIFDDLEETASSDADALWKDPKIQNATMYAKKAMAPINDYITKLSPSEKRAIPKDVMDVIDDLNAHPERDMPLTYIQNLRSQILGAGREAFRKGDNFIGGANNALARHIAENVIGDGSNIVFGDKSGAARDAWQKAVDATRDYHQTFNEGILKKLNQESAAGTPTVSLDSTFDTVLGGKNGTQNLGLMQKATNGAINDHVADYLMADINNNGTRIVKPSDIDKWLGKDNNKALVDMVPGMQDKIDALRSASEKQQLASNFRKVSSDPEKVIDLFENNREALNRLTDPADKAHFAMLENSARRMRDIPIDENANLESLNDLANGRTSDLLYGVGTGRIAKSVLGWAAAKTLEAKTGVDLGWLTDIAGVMAPQAAGKFGVDKVMEWALSGKVRDKALQLLQDARDNPELAARLMDKPTPETLRDLFGISSVRAPAIGAEQGVDYNDRLSKLQEKRSAEEQRREGRATGGKVGKHGLGMGPKPLQSPNALLHPDKDASKVGLIPDKTMDIAKGLSKWGKLEWGKPFSEQDELVQKAIKQRLGDVVDVEEPKRQERASGGGVTVDHEAESDRLVRMVDQIRKDLSNHTESNLKQPDDLVVKALALANRAV